MSLTTLHSVRQVDGKMVNVATGTASSQRCSMCGLTLRKFNDLTAVAAQPVTNLQYGLSTLHCWLRSFDCLLHLSYRLPLQEDSKERRQQRKAEVQEAFRTRMGLRVDEPRAGGSGNSNDGNTARRAFRSPAEFAACTGVDQELIDRVGTVLQAVSSLHQLDIDALSAYCRRTAELYVERYSHHPMSTTLHKLLSHSAAVVESCHLPIGMMSEEAAEATHKRVRQYRLRHTRKDSRIHTMSDLLGYLLVASDPLLSSLGLQRRRRLYANRHGQLQPQTLALLAEPRLHAPTAADDGNGSSDNSDVESDDGRSSSSSSD